MGGILGKKMGGSGGESVWEGEDMEHGGGEGMGCCVGG